MPDDQSAAHIKGVEPHDTPPAPVTGEAASQDTVSELREWFVRPPADGSDGEGPRTLAQLSELIAHGRLTRDHEVRLGSSDTWKGAGDARFPVDLFSSGDTPARWFTGGDGAEEGPFDRAQLQARAASGELRPETATRREHEAVWRHAGHVPDLQDLFARPPPPPTTARWYVLHDEKADGPLEWAELKEQAGRGRLVPDNLVWTPGLAVWRRAGEVGPLAAGLFKPAEPAGYRFWKHGHQPGAAQEVLPAAQLDALRARILERVDADKEEIAEELALALGLAQRIRAENTPVPDAAERLCFVVNCLTARPPKLNVARDERLRLQFDVYRKAGLFSRFLARISSGSAVGLVLVSLLGALLVWLATVAVVRYLIWTSTYFPSLSGLFDYMFFMHARVALVVASASFIGGVVSIATRLREFARLRDLDPTAMFWTAMLKPLIGVVLAFFLLAVLAANIVSFGFLDSAALATPDTLEPRTLYVLWVLAFLCGFSERFAYDFVDRAQGAASRATPPPATPDAGKAG